MAILLLIEHVFGTPSQIAIIKRDSLRKSTSRPKESIKSTKESIREDYYAVPPEQTDSNNESDESVSLHLIRSFERKNYSQYKTGPN